MNFGEAADYLANKVKRLDKAPDAETYINQAISIFATSNFFHDLVELDVALAAQDYIQAIDITASPFIRFRKVKYLRPTGYRKYLAWVDPSRIFTGGCEQTDSWYRSGNYLRFKLSNLQATLAIGYYQYHLPMTAAENTDWMLTEMFPAIEAYALSELHDDIGNVDEAGRWQRKWPALLQVYKDDLGDGVSYA